MAVASAIGVSVALLCAALLAVTAGIRGRGRPRLGSASTVFGAGVAYVVVVVPAFTTPGVSFLSLFLVAAVVAIPAVVAAVVANGRVQAGDGADATGDRSSLSRLGGSGRLVVLVAGVIVALALLLGQLAAAGQILSLTGALDRATASVAVGVAAALYLLPRGLAGAARTSRWLVWVLGVVVLLVLVMGSFGGEPAHVTSPTVPVEHPSGESYVAVILAVGGAAVFDPALRRWLERADSPMRLGLSGAGLVAGFVFLFGSGLLMFYGGSFQAPSLQFFAFLAVLPAFIVAIMMAAVAFLLATTTGCLLAAGSYVLDELSGSETDDADGAAQLGAEEVRAAAAGDPGSQAATDAAAAESRRHVWTLALAAVAIVLAVVAPAVEASFVAAGIVALASAGSILPAIWREVDGVSPVVALPVGIVGAVIMAAGVGFADSFAFSGRGALAMVTAFAAAAVTSAVTGRVAGPTRVSTGSSPA